LIFVQISYIIELSNIVEREIKMTKKSIRGVFHNLEDSTYIASNGELHLFFSSSSRLGKFLVGYMEYRNKVQKKMNSAIGESSFPYEYLADIEFYKQSENKGIFVMLEGEQITLDQMEKYIVGLIAERKELTYVVVSDPDEINEIRWRIETNGSDEEAKEVQPK
jgi:hypothetical protein